MGLPGVAPSKTFWQNFEMPPSRLERSVTRIFVEKGLYEDRVTAVAYAIPAIASSVFMFIMHTVEGSCKSAVLLTRGEFMSGFYKFSGGLFNSTRSIWTICLIFGTAVNGLAFPETMYGAMGHVTIDPSKEEIEKLGHQLRAILQQSIVLRNPLSELLKILPSAKALDAFDNLNRLG